MFGQGDNQFAGILTTDLIQKNEIIIKVPSTHIINTKVAFYSDINSIFYDNPQIFGKHVVDGEDNMLHAFILHEIQKKEKSKFYEMIRMWPKKADILMNWEKSDLEYLQDPTLMHEG